MMDFDNDDSADALCNAGSCHMAVQGGYNGYGMMGRGSSFWVPWTTTILIWIVLALLIASLIKYLDKK